MKAKYTCPSCGAPVIKERWESGYQYCKAKPCFETLGKKVSVFERVPEPGEVDLDPYELDDIQSMYDAD